MSDDKTTTFEIPAIIDDLDAVPAPIRDLYTEKGGKFHLESVKALRNALRHAKEEREAARKKADQAERWEKIGKTPEEIEELLMANAGGNNANGSDAQAILRQHQERWRAREQELTAELERERESTRKFFIENRLEAALEGKKNDAGMWAVPEATPEGKYFLKKELASRIRLDERDGTRAFRIMQDDGETPMAGSDPNGMATVEDLVQEASRKYPALFKGTGHGGSGAPGQGRAGGAGATAKPRSKMSFIEKASYIETFGRDAYMKLPA